MYKYNAYDEKKEKLSGKKWRKIETRVQSSLISDGREIIVAETITIPEDLGIPIPADSKEGKFPTRTPENCGEVFEQRVYGTLILNNAKDKRKFPRFLFVNFIIKDR